MAILASLLLQFGLEASEHMVCFERLGVRRIEVRAPAHFFRLWFNLHLLPVLRLVNRRGRSFKTYPMLTLRVSASRPCPKTAC
jgi:hypothetical protein